MAQGLDIRRRIKSIKSTRSITKAMQMVSASKMRKAQDQALRTRSYAEKALEILAAVSEKIRHYPHYLLSQPEGNESLVLVITSNKGLCGSLNTNVIRRTIEFMEEIGPKQTFRFVTLGKKGRDMMTRLSHPVVADFSDIPESLSFTNVVPLMRYIFDDYRLGRYSRVYIAYSHFVSVLNQKPIVKRLLPLGRDLLHSMRELVRNTPVKEVQEWGYEYLFEPNPAEVLEELLPRMVEMQIFQSYLESYASEQSARMVAMKNATEAAGDLIDDLTLTYNKARQASITQEISEIVGGAEALKR